MKKIAEPNKLWTVTYYIPGYNRNSNMSIQIASPYESDAIQQFKNFAVDAVMVSISELKKKY